MYVCMYVYMYVCVYVCMCVCMCVCMYVCMYVCIYVCMYVCMYICMIVIININATNCYVVNTGNLCIELGDRFSPCSLLLMENMLFCFTNFNLMIISQST